MITINLLPETYRATQAPSIQQWHRSPLAAVLVVLLLSPLAGLGVMVHLRQGQLNHVKAQLDKVLAQKQAVDGVKDAIGHLREQQASFTRLASQRSQWAKYLQFLPGVTPEGMWLTELSFDRQKGLVLQGAAISRGGEEMLQIGRMAQELKAGPGLSALVRDVQIESMKRVLDGEIELIHFTLSGTLVKATAETSS